MPPAEDLVTALYRLGLVQRAISRHAADGLGSQGFTALAVILRQGPIRVSDVAEQLSVSLPVASRQVAALVQAGHVERETDPADGRAHRLLASESGTRALHDAHGRMVETASSALAGWSDAEIAALASQLERLREDFAAMTTPITQGATP